MDTTLFLEQFGHLATSADGVKKLRGLVLDLAVRGQLVPQDPTDEPASVLLKQIQAEKQRLLKEKLIPQKTTLFPKQKPTYPIKLPINWEVAKLGTLCELLVDGSHNPPPDVGNGIPMISARNIINNEINFLASRFVSEDDYTHEIVRTPISEGDVLLTIVGSIGRSAVVPSNTPRFCIQRSIAQIKSYIDPYYVSLYLTSPVAHDYYAKEGKGTAQKGIYLNKISILDIPLPPLAEQQRIVAKVDELMRLCDQLEAELDTERHLRQEAVKTTTHHIMTSTDRAETRSHWHHAQQYFHELFDRPQTVGELRAMILQLAVRGQLVPQDPTDEPASVLLKQIQAEKQRRIKAGEIKKPIKVPEIESNGFSFDLPNGWVNVTIGELISPDGVFTDGDWVESKDQDPFGNVRLIQLADVGVGEYRDRSNRFITSEKAEELNCTKLEVGDVLIARLPEPLGRACIFPGDEKPCVTVVDVCIVRSANDIDNTCLQHFINSPTFGAEVRKYQIGTTRKRISRGNLAKIQFPLPPLAEQQRIVAKVDELMRLCDQLDHDAQVTHALASQLTDSVIHHLVGGS